MGKVIGIDLGTTNSAVSVMMGGKPEVISNKEGMRTTPSVIAISVDTKDEIVGITAKNQMVTNPEQTFYSVKRLIGMEYSDPSIAKDLKSLPFETRKSNKGGVEIKFGNEWVAPEAISAKVLAKIKRDAEAFLGETVTDAVITVPAYFNDAQRQATKNAGKIAGLNVLRIINEPTAAALAYGLDKNSDATIAVYDLGGGTFDVSILEIGDGVFEVKSTSGDTHLGGDDFDHTIMTFLVDEFKKEQGIDLSEDAAAMQRLKEAAEKAKITLSSAESTEINLPYITADAKGPKHMRLNLTRAQLENLIGDLVKKTIEPTKKALQDAGVTKEQINDVVLVGGMTRMPLVLKTVKEFFGKDPHQGVNPDEVVAVGAAIQGAVLAGDESVQDITLLDVTPLSLGIEVNYGEMHVLIPRNTTIPTEKTEDRFTTAADNQNAVDIKILQGERPMAADNKVLGTFRLDDIPPAPRGMPQFAVTFKIDANGILNVSAKDVKTGKEQSITITASTQLDESEVERLVKEAAENETKDKEVQEKNKLRNEADTLTYQAEKLVRDYGDKLPAEDKQKLEEETKKLSEESKNENFDKEKLQGMITDFTKLLQDTGAKIYESGADKPAEGANSESTDAAEAAEGEVVG